MLASCVALTPVLLWQRAVIVPALEAVWPLLLVTSGFSTVYNVALAAAYRSGDLSLVYPIARSLGPVLVAGASAGLGRGEHISAACLTGIALVVAGSFLLPLARFRAVQLSTYFTPSFLLALCTAAATAGYTLTDDLALRWLRASPAVDLGTAGGPLLYAALHAWATTLSLALFIVCAPAERRSIPRVARSQGRRAILVGLASYASYILILAAMGFVNDVTYVAGFRQLGIPLALLIGTVGLRESVSRPRWTGAALCTAGLLLIALR